MEQTRLPNTLRLPSIAPPSTVTALATARSAALPMALGAAFGTALLAALPWLAGLAMAVSAAPAHAGARASALVNSSNAQSAQDSETVAQGLARAGVSGAHGAGTSSHSFLVNASASGDSGTLRVDTRDTTLGNSGTDFARADAEIYDTLTFSGPGNGRVELSLSLHGAFRNTGGPSSLGFESFLAIVNGANVGVSGSWTDLPGGARVRYGVLSDSQGEVTIPPPFSGLPSNVWANQRVWASGPAQTFRIKAGLLVTANTAPNSTSNALFNNTAQLALSMPAGWTFTSESGSFLSVPPPPIPEPPAAALLAVGGGLLWALRQLRRRPAARHAAAVLAASACLAAPGAHAFEVTARASTTLSSVFPTTTSDVQTSQTLTSVRAQQAGPDPAFGSFRSTAGADVASGALRGLSTVLNNNPSAAPGMVTESAAGIDETLTFVAPAGAPATIPVTLILHAHGAFSALAGEGGAYALFSLDTDAGGSYFTVSCRAVCGSAQVGGNPGVTVLSTAPASWRIDMSQTFNVDPTLPFDLSARMSTQAYSRGTGSATLNAMNTASLELILPAGYGYTSSSGVFLSAVPEPATGWLLAAGLVLGITARQQRRRSLSRPPQGHAFSAG